jgi:O-antigen ligase
MTTFDSNREQFIQRLIQFGIVLFAIIVALVAGLLVDEQPILFVIGLLGLVLAIISVIWIDVTTIAFFIILLTNTGTIAVKFHGVPFIVGAAFPLLLFVPVLNYIVFRRERIVIIPMMFLMLGLLFVQLVGAFFAVRIDDAFAELLIFLIEAVVIYVLVINAVRTEKTLKLVILAMMISTVILGGIPLYQQISGTFDNNYGGYAQIPGRGFSTGEGLLEEEVQQRLAGAIGEKNRFAQIMLMLSIICVVQIPTATNKHEKLLAISAATIGFAAATLPFSRGAAVGFVLTILIAVPLKFISIRQLFLMIFLAVLMLIAFPQYTQRLVSIQSIIERATGNSSATTEADGAFMGRQTSMLAALIVYSEHPLFGVGPGQYRYYSQEVGNELGIKRQSGNRQAHNLYLDIAANMGTFGLILVMAITLLTIKQLVYVRKRWLDKRPDIAGIATGFALAMITYLTTGLFLHFAYVRYFWAFIAVSQVIYLISNKIGEISPKQGLSG